MRCPVCAGSLQRKKHQYVEFDICPQCRGIWVSGEQFRALAVKVATDGDVKPDEKLTFEPRKIIVPLQSKTMARNCPKCRNGMREFNYAYDSNVFLDRCEQCKGIWLDPSEIIDIAKHIQYNPDVVAFGKSFLDMKNNRYLEEELDRCSKFLEIAVIILRVLIFRF